MAATLSEHLNTDLQPRSAPTRAGAIARFERTTNRKSQAHPGRALLNGAGTPSSFPGDLPASKAKPIPTKGE